MMDIREFKKMRLTLRAEAESRMTSGKIKTKALHVMVREQIVDRLVELRIEIVELIEKDRRECEERGK